MKNIPLAVLEGPWSTRVAGCRHVMFVTKGYPSIVFSFDGGRRAAAGMGVKHYPAGTWEDASTGRVGFPLPRPEILSEIMGTQQKELAV